MQSRTFRLVASFLVPLAAVVTAALVQCRAAHAVERAGYTMEIVVDGMPLREYAARGTRYVEALKGSEYSVRLRNETGRRVAIALSVDGLNSIDARTTSAAQARKWVVGPYETITLDGWQTSAATARKFFFTTEEGSYGHWLGRTRNLGLVTAAVFREKRRQPIARERGDQEQDGARQSIDARDEAAPPSALPRRPDDLAATGIGEETNHPVRQVDFDAEDSPAAVLDLRYEYRDALVRLGVLPADDRRDDALERRERARGFTLPQFAPDPYRRRDR